MNILIVEDNRDIVDNIADFLSMNGHELDFAMDGLTAIQKVRRYHYDAVILDVMLPGADGFQVCRRIRQEESRHTPIIMLTARDTLEDKLEGFETGADDYLVKPFDLPELLARLKVLASRHSVSEKLLTVGGLSLNSTTRQVFKCDRAITLNSRCFDSLQVLMVASPGFVSREELERKLWADMPPGSDVLRTIIYTLRTKIDRPFSTNQIQTIHGIGFKVLP